MKRRWPLALLLILLPLLTGCFGAGGMPVPIDQLRDLQTKFEELDHASRKEVDSQLATLQQQVAQVAQSKDRAVREQAGRERLLAAYCWERRGDFSDAERNYAEAGKGPYAVVALFRLAQVAEYQKAQAEAEAQSPNLEETRRREAAEIAKLEGKKEVRALERVANFPVGSEVLLREPLVASLPLQAWHLGAVRHEAYDRLDGYYRTRTSYQVMAFLVRLCGGTQQVGQPKKSYPYILAIVLIAVLAKLVTTPLTAAQFKSMRAMQAMQPELKKLQEKYKDDKQQMSRAQMELFKQHKINPASSCLPMLIQFPILIWVYYAIRYFVYQFEGVHFLYLPSLAEPDVIPVGVGPWPGPLLVLYGVSMYFSQKLLSQPTATPEQQQQQKMMAYMMPVILLFVLKGLPAAFILYWLLQNILMTGHQWLIMRPQRLVQATAAAAAAAPPPLPPEAIQKLSQGSRSGKKKKKRR